MIPVAVDGYSQRIGALYIGTLSVVVNGIVDLCTFYFPFEIAREAWIINPSFNSMDSQSLCMQDIKKGIQINVTLILLKGNTEEVLSTITMRVKVGRGMHAI